MVLRKSTTGAVPALLLLVVVSAGGCGGDGSGRSPTAPMPAEALNRAAETASAAAAASVFAVSTDTVLNLAHLESLGTYDPASGWWQANLALQNGWPARLRWQLGDADGTVQAHYLGATTTWVRVVGSTTASVQYAGSSEHALVDVTFDLTLRGIEASSNWVTYDGGGTCSAPNLAATFLVMHLGQPRSGTGFPGDGAMNVNVRETNVNLRFRGQQGVEGMYYDPYNLKSFSVDLTNGDIYRN